ncbi:hypothetical protein IT399_03030 [Candidatus Nomurabacteria bacterium]|nr:hypothetical protein [Candidatus Nomurabacteria bacterium]
MEEIKNLFVKHFGFYPDIISTTEHAYISPPSRIISSLLELSKFSNKKILRVVMTDTFAVPPEKSVRQICLPHLLNKNIFLLNFSESQENFIKKFKEDKENLKKILFKKLIFSSKEKQNYIDLINLYNEVFENIKIFDSVNVYNDIIKAYVDSFELNILNKWLRGTYLIGIDSAKVRIFLKDVFEILCKNDAVGVELFGKYLEEKKRLKIKDANNDIKIISWNKYLEELQNISNTYYISTEIILYVYSYGVGSHFGNDYGVVSDINHIQNSNNLLQITEHNKDFSFKIEEQNIEFHHVNTMKNNLNFSQKMYKTINTLPELYVVFGKENLKNRLKLAQGASKTTS